MAHVEETGEHKRSDCALSKALDIFGDRWSLLLIRDLMFTPKRSYSEFLQSAEGIATNILATRLQMLEDRGIVTKSADPANGRRSLYHLTHKGQDLLPILLEMQHWSAKHEGASACVDVLKRLKRDREGVMKELIAGLKAAHKMG